MYWRKLCGAARQEHIPLYLVRNYLKAAIGYCGEGAARYHEWMKKKF